MFENVAETYIEAALNYMKIVESDHLVTILLESKSDINNMSALDMALEYRLTSFVKDTTVERISTSIMNNWQFLQPINKETSFEIDPLSIDLLWDKLWSNAYRHTFYFTPLGLYVTTIFLYVCFLILFTCLSFSKFRVYDNMTFEEKIFWLFNWGYILNEIQSIYTEGIKQYYSTKENYFDTIISSLLLIMFSIRFYCVSIEPPCDMEWCDDQCMKTQFNSKGDDIERIPCWYGNVENALFVILWAACTCVLYVRLILFCVLSTHLGPMVQMIFTMGRDIFTFFTLFAVIFAGFVIC